ncbi:MAG: ABC transporter permease, partial [Armatimonadota bacterium]|nr:ABC transporter permease [Armatimonadota bacterium]
WVPAFGYETWRHLLLPSVTLGAASAAIVARMTRSSMLEVLGQDYIRTARAKGLAERVVVNRHALRNALIPVVTVLGLQLGTLLSGAVLTETVFAWPGIGRLLVDAVLARDYPIIQGATLLIAATFVALNLAVDLLYGLLDPRIRYE